VENLLVLAKEIPAGSWLVLSVFITTAVVGISVALDRGQPDAGQDEHDSGSDQ
jgi:hypothetical protein